MARRFSISSLTVARSHHLLLVSPETTRLAIRSDNSVLPLPHDAKWKVQSSYDFDIAKEGSYEAQRTQSAQGKDCRCGEGRHDVPCSHRYWRWRHRHVLYYQRGRC